MPNAIDRYNGLRSGRWETSRHVETVTASAIRSMRKLNPTDVRSNWSKRSNEGIRPPNQTVDQRMLKLTGKLNAAVRKTGRRVLVRVLSRGRVINSSYACALFEMRP